MRLHVTLEDELVREIDRVAGPRGRTAYIAAAVRVALEADRQSALIRAGTGSIPDTGHEWDDDPAAWVRAQRFADARHVG